MSVTERHSVPVTVCPLVLKHLEFSIELVITIVKINMAIL